ncbi:protein of unknown function [Methylocella tundrae]|uniref:Uncharacterized protein n=1 Tax=Methylocella tundrae TaxID=227605 RepID=A0A4V6IMB5_METTU|nr:protein of unknown function [Methylocella tundrae]
MPSKRSNPAMHGASAGFWNIDCLPALDTNFPSENRAELQACFLIRRLGIKRDRAGLVAAFVFGEASR